MGKLVKDFHRARLEFVQIGVSATKGAYRGLCEEGVTHGDCCTFGVCVWLVAWLDRLLAFEVIGSTNIVDSDCIILIAAQFYKFGKNSVVLLDGVSLALVMGRNK